MKKLHPTIERLSAGQVVWWGLEAGRLWKAFFDRDCNILYVALDGKTYCQCCGRESRYTKGGGSHYDMCIYMLAKKLVEQMEVEDEGGDAYVTQPDKNSALGPIDVPEPGAASGEKHA